MAQDKLTVNIDSIFNPKGFKQLEQALFKSQAVAKTFADNYGQMQRNTSLAMKQAGSGVVSQMQKGFLAADNSMIGLDKTVMKSQKDMAMFSSQFEKSHKNITKLTDTTTGAVKKSRQQFAGWALSVLFIGQMIQKTFTAILKTSTKVFQDVAHSINGAVTNIDILGGEMTYLKFVMGEAINTTLSKWLPTIIDIIDGISRWIEKNPKLATTMVVLTAAIAALAVQVAQIILLFNGLKMAGIIAEGSTLKSVFMGLWKTLSSKLIPAMKWIAANPMKSLSAGLMISGIIMAVAWIFKLKDAMGGWGEFSKNLLRGIVKAWDVLVAKIVQAKTFIVQLAWGDSIQEASRVAQDAYSRSIDQANMRRAESLGTPEKGFIQPRSISQIMKAELYDDMQSSGVTYNIDTMNIQANNTEEMSDEMVRQAI